MFVYVTVFLAGLYVAWTIFKIANMQREINAMKEIFSAMVEVADAGEKMSKMVPKGNNSYIG